MTKQGWFKEKITHTRITILLYMYNIYGQNGGTRIVTMRKVRKIVWRITGKHFPIKVGLFPNVNICY